MKTRLVVQFSGYHENGRSTDKKFTILNLEGEVNMHLINQELSKEFSSYRNNKEINIHHLQSF